MSISSGSIMCFSTQKVTCALSDDYTGTLFTQSDVILAEILPMSMGVTY